MCENTMRRQIKMRMVDLAVVANSKLYDVSNCKVKKTKQGMVSETLIATTANILYQECPKSSENQALVERLHKLVFLFRVHGHGYLGFLGVFPRSGGAWRRCGRVITRSSSTDPTTLLTLNQCQVASCLLLIKYSQRSLLSN